MKVKRELRALLKAMAEERSRKCYSPTPDEDVVYDTILVKESLVPVFDELPP